MTKRTKIAYDLGLNQSMYRVPEGVIQNLELKYPVKFKLINTPNSEKIYKEAEIYWGNRIDASIIKNMPNLKWVHFGSVGINRLNNLSETNFIITSSKGLVTSAMTTNIIALIGFYSRSLNVFFENKLDRPRSRDDFEEYFDTLKNFDELQILILGLGDIGQSLAKKLYLLGAKVDSISRNNKNLNYIRNEIKLNQSNNDFKKYDFIISLLPDNPSTKNLLNYSFFSELSKNSIFINAGRGNTVLEKDLIKSLDLGSPKFAILDVIKNEPLSVRDDIYKHSKTLITPHIFAFSPSYWPLEIKLFESNLLHYLDKNLDCMKNLEFQK